MLNYKFLRKKKPQENLWDLGPNKEFLDLTTKTQLIVGNTDKLDVIEINL